MPYCFYLTSSSTAIDNNSRRITCNQYILHTMRLVLRFRGLLVLATRRLLPLRLESRFNFRCKSLMCGNMLEAVFLDATDDKLMCVVVDVHIVQCDNDLVAKDPGHLFERNAFCLWERLKECQSCIILAERNVARWNEGLVAKSDSQMQRTLHRWSK